MKISQKDLDEVFPNAPLVDVAFEIRFRPLLMAVDDVSLFQARVRDIYPRIAETRRFHFPPIEDKEEERKIDKLWEFSNPTEDKMLRVSIQSFSVIWKSYETFEDFRGEILLRVNDFCHTYPIEEFTRTGLRYTNQIKLPADEAHDNLKRYVVIPINTYDHEMASVFIHRNETRFRIEGDSLTVRTAFFERDEKSPSQSTYILDYDCYRDTLILINDLRKTLDQFHHVIQLQFLSQVTEDYKDIMRKAEGPK